MSYDYYAVGCSVVLVVGTYLMIGKRPRQFYARITARIRWLFSLRLISESELNNLYRQIDVLKEQITMLHTAPIKQEKGGQLQFSELFSDSGAEQSIKLGPFPGKNSTLWWQVWKSKDLANYKADKYYVRRDKRRPSWVDQLLKGDIEIDAFIWKQLSPDEIAEYTKVKA